MYLYSISLLQLLWQAADRHHQAQRCGPAAALFQLGTHKIMSTLGMPTAAKCRRKSAICHLQAREYARAAQVVRQSDENCRDAGTCFVLFLVAAEQGLEDEGPAIVPFNLCTNETHLEHGLSSIARA